MRIAEACHHTADVQAPKTSCKQLSFRRARNDIKNIVRLPPDSARTHNQDEHPLSGITTCPEMQDFRPAHPFLAIVLKQHEAWIMLLTKTFSTRLLCRKQCRPHNALPVDPPISTRLATRQDNGSEPSAMLRYHIIRNTHRQYKNAQPDKRHTPSRTGCSGTKKRDNEYDSRSCKCMTDTSMTDMPHTQLPTDNVSSPEQDTRMQTRSNKYVRDKRHGNIKGKPNKSPRRFYRALRDKKCGNDNTVIAANMRLRISSQRHTAHATHDRQRFVTGARYANANTVKQIA